MSGTQVELIDPASITGRDPVLVAASTQSITGLARTTVLDRFVKVTQTAGVYRLELVPKGGLTLYIR